MPVVGFAMLIFMLGEGRLQRRTGWLSGLRLPVASSDLRTKRVAQLGANLWLYHVTRDDNDILWGLATKSDKISFMRWKGLERWKLISSSSQFLKCSSTAGTCISPADFLRFEAFARPQASSYGPVKLEKQRFSAQTEPRKSRNYPKLSETIRNSQTQLQTCLRKDPKHPKTYPNDEECIRMHKNATEIWHLCNWLLHIAVALLRLQALSG